MSKTLFAIYIILILCSYSCKKNKTQDEDSIKKDSFDKKALLVNMADNVIIPNYISFSNSLDSLISTYNTFKVSQSIEDFVVVKQIFNSTYLKYQNISAFEFGPAEQEILRMNFNVFPTDTNLIKNNISSGTYNLQLPSNFNAKGFSALDYLFYDLNKTESQIVQSFVSTPNKKKYISDLLNEMQSKTKTVLSAWNSSYKNVFINSLGTDIGSSIGYLVNQLNYELDHLKNGKIGIPLGKKTLDMARPNQCEAYYSQKSLDNALATLTNIENIYLGKSSNGNDGIGFDDYLNHLGSTYATGTLNNAIKNQFILAKTKLIGINGILSKQVIANPSVVNAAYMEIVKLLVLLKTDLPSNLGVIITYQDGDGD